MVTHRTRLIPLVLAIPVLACVIFEGGPTEPPAPLPSETPAIEPSLAPPPPTDTLPALPPTIELPTEGPGPAGWPCYSNEWAFPFTICYPPDATLTEAPPDQVRIDLPVAPGTNLIEKWLEILVSTGAPECSGPLGGGEPPEVVSIMGPYNELEFLRESGSEGAAGSRYEWVGYSTAWGDTCVSLTFVLHSGVMFDPPLPEFDLAAESAIFDMILATFYWWG
jgi:hypothetical protein